MRIEEDVRDQNLARFQTKPFLMIDFQQLKFCHKKLDCGNFPQIFKKILSVCLKRSAQFKKKSISGINLEKRKMEKIKPRIYKKRFLSLTLKTFIVFWIIFL